ncbi:hypothetical protein FOZ63_000620 [Perkinsus olseni]|uniref:DUF7047 domain-containing protein n=1 Tax=Perkinsus olseni TaxID=32597 RepID=A0A7J6SAV5_PEROL|nr:hypothetical protein FOZ63_000620 [Perkinsus olseni]
MEAHLGAAAIPLKPIRAYNLESCDVKEYLDAEGRTHTVLEAPDCTAVRRPVRGNSSTSYEWEVAWRWRDDKPPDTISCPEEYSLSYLTPDQLALLHQEIDTWIKDGWLLEVSPEQECNIRCCLPIVPAINELKSTPVRPTLNFAFLNSHCVQASDPFAADCGKELRRWRCCPQAQILDVRRAYPSLKIRDDLSWYQCLRYKGTYFRLVRLGFGASCAPRLLKNVLDFVLQNYPTTLRYFDDILVARSPTQSLDDFKKSVAEVRSVLSQNGLKTKDPVDLNGAHLLGLEIYKDDTGTLLWRRRLPLESLLESIEARFDKPPLLTAREVGSWLGKLVAHVPCAGYLRACVAVGRRLLNHSCGKDRSAWSRPVADDVRDFVKKLCSVIRQSGDPAFGRWLLPESSEKIRCWVDASQLAEAVLLTDSANLILADGAWLAPTGDVGSTGKPSTHINVRELDVIIRGIKYLAF